MNEQEAVAISSTPDIKLAALFFDSVYPIAGVESYHEVPDGILFKDWGKYAFKFSESFQPALTEYEDLIKDDKIREEIKWTNVIIADQINKYIFEIRKSLFQSNIRSTPIFSNEGSYNFYNSEKPGSSIEVEILKIPLIKTDNMSWEQILEVRADNDFKRRIRNFRLFLIDNYQNKTKEYIHDSLLKKIDEYESSCKKHGLELLFSTIKTTLNSKNILATISLATLAILLGEPIVAGVSSIVSASLEVGKISINIAEKKLSMQSMQNESDISYLFNLKRIE